MIWLILTPLLATFVIYTAFLVLCAYKLIEDTGVEIPVGIKRVATIWYGIGAVADVVYNGTVGFFRFWEFRGLTYSEHIQTRVDRGIWDRQTKLWALFLNAGRKNHIKRVPQ